MDCGDARMVWMLMPGQTWAGAAASFVLMWVAMMIPMMAPSLAPALWRYRRTARAAIAGAGYFFVWALLGLAVYPLGVLFAQADTRGAAGIVVLAAGLVQFSAWKKKHLACCREVAHCCTPADGAAAWLHGMHLGVRCAVCCGNLMAVLLVTGVMEPVPMVAVTAAITLERWWPAAARLTGAVIVGAGLFLFERALNQ
jgi:predicted metal-binding membrane protein